MTVRPLLVVCGLRAEAAIAAAPGVITVVGGGQAERLRERLAARLAAERPRGVLSFGVAGALDPALRTGDLLAATAVRHAGRAYETDPPWRERLVRELKAQEAAVASSAEVAASPAAKARLRALEAAAVDMESGVVAELCHAAGTPFAVLRAVSDEAGTTLPPSAVAGMGPQGEVRVGQVLLSLARRPQDLPGLAQAGRDAARAAAALRRARATLGVELGWVG